MRVCSYYSCVHKYVCSYIAGAGAYMWFMYEEYIMMGVRVCMMCVCCGVCIYMYVCIYVFMYVWLVWCLFLCSVVCVCVCVCVYVLVRVCMSARRCMSERACVLIIILFIRLCASVHVLCIYIYVCMMSE